MRVSRLRRSSTRRPPRPWLRWSGRWPVNCGPTLGRPARCPGMCEQPPTPGHCASLWPDQSRPDPAPARPAPAGAESQQAGLAMDDLTHFRRISSYAVVAMPRRHHWQLTMPPCSAWPPVCPRSALTKSPYYRGQVRGASGAVPRRLPQPSHLAARRRPPGSRRRSGKHGSCHPADPGGGGGPPPPPCVTAGRLGLYAQFRLAVEWPRNPG